MSDLVCSVCGFRKGTAACFPCRLNEVKQYNDHKLGGVTND